MKTNTLIVGWMLMVSGPIVATRAADLAEEFKVKRQEAFEFTQKPKVTREGDKVTIVFACKAACDVTVAIEDAKNRILRHLASGVLGPNAPEPFKKNSLEQAIVWDGKDDQGAYVDDKDACTVRVSLGLKPRFERQFLWSPCRRIANQGFAPTLYAPGSFVAQPEGVYVSDGSMHDHIRLFDHEGNYVRTVYPFPSDKLDKLKGVKTQLFPQSGKVLPLKGGNYRSTLLTSGTNREGNYLTQLFGLGATAMAVRNGRIALVGNRLNRLGTDGTTGGLPLEGPDVCIRGTQSRFEAMPDYLPRSAALSPDGKTLYVTGWNKEFNNPNWVVRWIQGVAKIDMESGAKMEVFAGALSPDTKTSGAEPGKLKSPVSVDTDPQGRVYVAEPFNERIQIFDPSGKHLKFIPVPGGEVSRPTEVAVNQRNGDVFVFAWYADSEFRTVGEHSRRAKLFHFGPFDHPELKAEYPLPIADQSGRGRYGGDQWEGREFRAAIDSWAPGDLPYVWMYVGFAPRGQRSILTPMVYRINPEKKGLEVVKSFDEQQKRDLGVQDDYWGYGARGLACRPTTGELYMPPFVVNPDTGKTRTVRLPVGGTPYFDWEGRAYLRDVAKVARYDADTWREIPFDYGEERPGFLSIVPLLPSSLHCLGTFSVSVRGDVVVGAVTGGVEVSDPAAEAKRMKEVFGDAKPWAPPLFEGRAGNSLVRVFDKHGKIVHEDAVKGVGYLHGVFMDERGSLYLASEAQRHGYFDDLTGTFVKFRPNGRILSDEATLPAKDLPARPPDTHKGAGHRGNYWWEGAEWFYGGIGYSGKNNSTCHCPSFSCAFDYFARSFVPETGHYSVAVLDSAGNLVLRIGQYGNVDDGVPLIADGPPIPNRRSIGGDEVGLFYPAYLAVHSDRRLFINDPGNQRVVSVKLGYHAEEKVALKDVKDAAR